MFAPEMLVRTLKHLETEQYVQIHPSGKNVVDPEPPEVLDQNLNYPSSFWAKKNTILQRKGANFRSPSPPFLALASWTKLFLFIKSADIIGWFNKDAVDVAMVSSASAPQKMMSETTLRSLKWVSWSTTRQYRFRSGSVLDPAGYCESVRVWNRDVWALKIGHRSDSAVKSSFSSVIPEHLRAPSKTLTFQYLPEKRKIPHESGSNHDFYWPITLSFIQTGSSSQTSAEITGPGWAVSSTELLAGPA